MPFERRKNKSKDVTFIEELLPDLLNALCDLILFDIPVEGDPDGQLLADWEYARQEIANTLTNIASQGIEDIKDREPTEEEKKIYGA